MDKKIRKAIFAGSFDPITNGHLDIISRASKLFDELQIGVLINPNKKGLFSLEERVELINACTKDLDNIKESMEILSKLNCDNIEHLKYVGYPVIKENKNLDNDTSFIRSVISNSEFINEEFTSHIKGLNNEKLIKYKE